MDLHCETMREMILIYADYADEIPDAKQKKEYLRHLEQCDACRIFHNEILQTISLAGHSVPPVPKRGGLSPAERALAAIKSEHASDTVEMPKPKRALPVYRIGTIAAAAFVVLLLAAVNNSALRGLFKKSFQRTEDLTEMSQGVSPGNSMEKDNQERTGSQFHAVSLPPDGGDREATQDGLELPQKDRETESGAGRTIAKSEKHATADYDAVPGTGISQNLTGLDAAASAAPDMPADETAAALPGDADKNPPLALARGSADTRRAQGEDDGADAFDTAGNVLPIPPVDHTTIAAQEQAEFSAGETIPGGDSSDGHDAGLYARSLEPSPEDAHTKDAETQWTGSPPDEREDAPDEKPAFLDPPVSTPPGERSPEQGDDALQAEDSGFGTNDNAFYDFVMECNEKASACTVHSAEYHTIPFELAQAVGYDAFLIWYESILDPEAEYSLPNFLTVFQSAR